MEGQLKEKKIQGMNASHEEPHSQIIGEWAMPQSIIEKEAYRLWETGHSNDAETNWFEAERSISSSMS
jgi:hypothetical protein